MAKFAVLLPVEFLNDYLFPCGYVYFQRNQDVLDPLSSLKRADYDLPEDKFLFACFNQLYKMDSDVFSAWSVFTVDTDYHESLIMHFPVLFLVCTYQNWCLLNVCNLDVYHSILMFYMHRTLEVCFMTFWQPSQGASTFVMQLVCNLGFSKRLSYGATQKTGRLHIRIE
jgi:hypothetical protein